MLFCPSGHFESGQKQEYFSWKEISRDVLLMGDILGQGEFGLVMKAVLTSEESSDVPVAVKSVKGISECKFLSEVMKIYPRSVQHEQTFKATSVFQDKFTSIDHLQMLPFTNICYHKHARWLLVMPK